MNEPVIDIRDRIEKMRNQMSPQSIQKKDNIKSNSPGNSGIETDGTTINKGNVDKLDKKDDTKYHKKSISENINEKKREFNKNFEDTETITKISVEKNTKNSYYSPGNTEQVENSFKKNSKSVKPDEETTFPQFSLNVSNPISWKLMLLIMVMQLLTNIMLVVVLYLK